MRKITKIHVYPTGRLGNQLYFASMALALRKILDSQSVENKIIFYSSEHTKALELLFNFKADRVKKTPLLFKLIGKKSMRDANYVIRGMHKATLIKRQLFASEVFLFSDLQKKLTTRINISRSQHEYAFFKSIKVDLIANKQKYKSKTYASNGFQIENFDSAVALHMRFGDFLEPSVANQYGNLDTKYYSKAIEILADNEPIQEIEIQLFSDDIDKSKKLLAQIGCVNVKTLETEDLKPEEELLIMSQYTRIIISNSTFSWWAGYLAENNATVIAPNPLMKNAASELSRSPNWTYIDGWL